MLRVLQRRAVGRRSNHGLIYGAPPQRGLGRMIRNEHQHLQQRSFIDIPTILLPPVVFTGLGVALWTWKCFMMIIFQNKIIYMPGLPPSARHERLEDYKNQCSGVQWREEKTRSEDGTKISLCVASVSSRPSVNPEKEVYILYFQGNASSLPPRLPFLSLVLRMLGERSLMEQRAIKYTIVCCSYRGYWKSSGRPSESGLTMDAMATLKWIYSQRACLVARTEPKLVIWGQSIGAGVAAHLAAHCDLLAVTLSTLILETPFLSIRAMLETLYPQKWLPYRYLWPFLRNHLDSWRALGELHKSLEEEWKGEAIFIDKRLPDERGLAPKFLVPPDPASPEILLLEAGKDELVPKEHGDALELRCQNLGLRVNRKTISGALHTDVMSRNEGRMAVVEAIERAAASPLVDTYSSS